MPRNTFHRTRWAAVVVGLTLATALPAAPAAAAAQPSGISRAAAIEVVPRDGYTWSEGSTGTDSYTWADGYLWAD
jgi:hypothetical protein